MVKIISDSTCDLSPELREKYGVDIIPLYVRLGNEEYEDGVSITPDKIFEWSDETKETPTTAAPSMDRIMDTYKRYLDAGDDILVFTISATMSSSFNNCRIAAEELEAEERVRVVDSMNLSMGIGLMIIEAAEMSQAGKSLDEIYDTVCAMRARVRTGFVVDTLVYLHRGGRCSGLAAMLGGALKLHPKIEVIDGKMHPGKKYRGALPKYIIAFVKDLEEELLKADTKRLGITHSDCDKETVNTVKTMLEDLGVFDEIVITNTGSVISSHCGPGTLGILYLTK